jgi:hypothetical protein
MITLFILSQSEIKKCAVINVFPQDKYRTIFIKVPDNKDRKSQPINKCGTYLACNQRFSEFCKLESYTQYKDIILSKDTYVISIESGVMNVCEKESDECDFWCDFCMIGLFSAQPEKSIDLTLIDLPSLNVNKNYFVSPEIIMIDQKYSKPYFEYYYEKNNDIDTLGKYISKVESMKGMIVSHDNWMKDIVGIDRCKQIEIGLVQVKNTIKK